MPSAKGNSKIKVLFQGLYIEVLQILLKNRKNKGKSQKIEH
jgi:hypothetical protein